MASNPNEHDFARLQSLLGHVLDASVEGIFAVDRDLKVTIFNAALERAFNVVRASVLGREILKSFPCMAAAGEEALMRGALAGTAASAKSHAFEIEAGGRKGRYDIAYCPLHGEGGAVVGALARLRFEPEGPETAPAGASQYEEKLRAARADVENSHAALRAELDARVESERRQEALLECGRALAEPIPLVELASKVLRVASEFMGWEAAELWLSDARDGTLRWEAFWYVPGLDAQAFEKTAWSMALKPGEGLIGRVAAEGRLWVPDLAQEESFQRTVSAARAGLRCACGVRVSGADGTLGVLALYAKKTSPASEEVLRVLEEISRQLGLTIEKRRAEEERDRLFSLSPAMLCVVGFDGLIRRANTAWSRALGYAEEELRGKSFAGLAHPADREAVDEALRGLAHGGGPRIFELRAVSKAGSILKLLWSAAASGEEELVYAAAEPVSGRTDPSNS